jgi:hypothetical protein
MHSDTVVHVALQKTVRYHYHYQKASSKCGAGGGSATHKEPNDSARVAGTRGGCACCVHDFERVQRYSSPAWICGVFFMWGLHVVITSDCQQDRFIVYVDHLAWPLVDGALLVVAK